MKKYYLIATIAFFLAWSCSSDEETEKGNNEDVTNIEQSEENKEEFAEAEEQQEPEIAPKFKMFLTKFSKTALPYNENPDGTEAYSKIPMNEQVDYLSKAEKLSEADLKDMSDYTDFYYISNPLSTKKFHVIVYGRFEMGSTYYFLCTYDNEGKLISNIDFAAYELIGAGPNAGQEYNTKGLIDKTHEITVKSDEETRKYKINEDGKIVKI